MAAFKKLNLKTFAKSGPVFTPDNEYWKKLNVPVLVKEFGPIDYIDFSPVEPYYFAVTCSVRVQVYNPITKLVAKNLSKFKENAYGATFRSDGRLLCAGGEETNVKLFDVNSKSLLRVFKGHTAPVHRTCFTHDNVHIASFSDDKSVKIWDIATEKPVITYSDAHKDYVRAGTVNSVVPDIVLSGSYDNTARMYDTRTNSCVLDVNHGCPIESLLFLPSGGIFLTAGGTYIKVWDTFAGGKLLSTFSSHHKTITCLHLASNNKRIMSGSLDRHVKIYDVSTFNVVHTLDFPNAVLSLAASKNDETIVAGMVDGLISIQRRDEEIKQNKFEKKKLASYKYKTVSKNIDEEIEEEIPKRLEARYNKHLRKFEFRQALEYVLIPIYVNKYPAKTASVLQELIKRKALRKALSGCDSKSMTNLLRFLIKYISDYRFTRILIDVTNNVLDVIEDVIHLQSADVGKMFIMLAKRLQEEQELAEQLAHLQGALQLLVAGATANQHVSLQNVANNTHNLIPSEDAQKNLVVNLT